MTTAWSDRGAVSRGKLLDIIRSEGPVSRVEIAQIAGLTQAAVSMIVRALLDDGLVSEVGLVESTGGRKRVMLEITPSARCAVGIHLSNDSIVYVVSNMAGSMIGRQRRPGVGTAEPAIMIERIGEEVDELLQSLGVARDDVVGIGVAATAPINYSAGALAGAPSLARWNSYPLSDQLRQRTGLPVVLDKDATAAAIGEFWGGRVEAPLSFACLYMGGGIGSGIVINGAALRGSASNAGEIGHVSLDIHGVQCFCGNRGCLETFAAPAAVVARARAVSLELPASRGENVSREFDDIARRAVNGDPRALGLIRESADYVAEGALTLVNITDLDLIVLAGPGFAIAGAIYIEAIRRVITERFFARQSHGVEVRLSTNPRDAAAMGASALMLQQSLAPRG